MKRLGKIIGNRDTGSSEYKLWCYIRDEAKDEIRWRVFDEFENPIDKGILDIIRETLYEAT